MPRVGNKQHDVARVGRQHQRRLSVAGQVDFVAPISRWCLTRTMTAGDDGGRATLLRAVFEIDVHANRKDGIRNAVIPGDSGGPRDVRSGINVPVAHPGTGFSQHLVSPGRVGDHVAVFAEQRFHNRMRRSETTR